jgi:hypothetical protein
MRILIAIALFAGGIVALHAPADSADAVKKRGVKPRIQTVQTARPRVYSREEVECERAQHEDPAGYYAGYPCWARAALGSGQNGNGADRP